MKTYTTGKIAKLCGVTKVTVLRWIKRGELKAYQLPGGQNRITEADFKEFAKRYGIPAI
jgi:excisionase family DNA binding protein